MTGLYCPAVALCVLSVVGAATQAGLAAPAGPGAIAASASPWLALLCEDARQLVGWLVCSASAGWLAVPNTWMA
jgi:hypothetical protein